MKIFLSFIALAFSVQAVAYDVYSYKHPDGSTALGSQGDSEFFEKWGYTQHARIFEDTSEKDIAIALAQQKALAKKPNATIGMSANQVAKNTNWGEPEYKNKTITKYGTSEQWVYKYCGYLYFENGKLTTIQY